jgi:HD superfamily phosphodiesterase
MKLLDYQPGELAAKLRTYLDNDSSYKTVYDYTKQRFHKANHLGAHNWEHAYRDTLNAIVIGEAEGANMRIVLPATTMHDIGFLYGATGRTHGAIGADKLSEFLQQGSIAYLPEDIEKMAACIRTHKGSMHEEKPETLEAKVVADADLLEKFGPFGVYSGLRTYAEFNYPLDTAIAREKQVLELTLETPTGRRLVEPGRQFVANFYKELREAADAYALEDGKHEA